MELIKPPFAYYSIDEVAEQLSYSIKELLKWGMDGKLLFSIRLIPFFYIEKVSLKCSSCGLDMDVPEHSDYYPLSVNTLKAINGDERARFNPILICECGKDLYPTFYCNDNNECYSGNIDDYIYKVSDLLVRFEDLKNFISYCTVNDEAQTPTNQEARQPEKQAQEISKQRLIKLEEHFQNLKKVEKDQDVIAARLRDENNAKYWHIVELFNIQLPPNSKSKDPQRDKDKKAERSVKKGRKILERRSEVK